MKYDYDDCYDEVDYLKNEVDIDYTALNKIDRDKQKIKKQNKNKKNNTQIKVKIENKE